LWILSLKACRGWKYLLLFKQLEVKSHLCFQWIIFCNWSSNKHYNCDASPSCKVCQISRVKRAVVQEPSKWGKGGLRDTEYAIQRIERKNNTYSRVFTLWLYHLLTIFSIKYIYFYLKYSYDINSMTFLMTTPFYWSTALTIPTTFPSNARYILPNPNC